MINPLMNWPIHAILANKHANSTLAGITITYDTPASLGGEEWTPIQCWKAATALTKDLNFNQNYKDSTGVYVFFGNLPSKTDVPTGNGWTWRKLIAHILAHEIGHALGISQHVNNWGLYDGVMQSPADLNKKYDDFDHFNGQELGRADGNAINTREQLGVQSVSLTD